MRLSYMRVARVDRRVYVLGFLRWTVFARGQRVAGKRLRRQESRKLPERCGTVPVRGPGSLIILDISTYDTLRVDDSFSGFAADSGDARRRGSSRLRDHAGRGRAHRR